MHLEEWVGGISFSEIRWSANPQDWGRVGSAGRDGYRKTIVILQTAVSEYMTMEEMVRLVSYLHGLSSETEGDGPTAAIRRGTVSTPPGSTESPTASAPPAELCSV